MGLVWQIAVKLFLHFLEEAGAVPRRLTQSLLVSPCGHGLLEALFTLGMKGESPVSVNLEARMHALNIYLFFFFLMIIIPGFGFISDTKIRADSSI